jgi:hypothetical protein
VSDVGELLAVYDLSHEDHSWIDRLAEERAADPQGLSIFVAEAGGRTVCDGWVRFPSGTEFATFWGVHTAGLAPTRDLPRARRPPGKARRRAAAATSRSTPPTKAARSWNGWRSLP